MVSFLLFLAAAIPVAIAVFKMQNGPSIGIIGGNDAPIASYITWKVIAQDPLFIFAIAAFALFVVSLIVLLVMRVKKHKQTDHLP
jgi:Na+-transporting methylmalonyl-CoA/oxaloacetate decarboxylase beta subunit